MRPSTQPITYTIQDRLANRNMFCEHTHQKTNKKMIGEKRCKECGRNAD